MISTTLALIGGVILLGAGALIGYLVRRQLGIQRVDSAESKAEKILSEAKIKESEFLLKAKEKALQLIDEAKREADTRHKEVKHLQERVERRETLFDQKLLELQEKQQKLQEKATQIDQVKSEILSIKQEQIAKLERVASMNREEAKGILLENVEREAKEDILARVKKVEQEGMEEIYAKARSIVTDAMQRCAMSVISENTTTVIPLPSDDMKGRIIGKEGRNIRTIESLTEVEILIDDTPGVITLSSFSLIRRHVAKRTIEKLMKDGRIHPGRVEEYVEQAKQELAGDINKAGEEAVFALGVTGLDPRLIQILGRLKYRTSFGQNALMHSMEVAYLSQFLAEELGANVAVCKKGGLLHDIGKAVDHEVQGSHPQIGYQIMKKFNLPEEVAYMSIAHHEDSPKTLEGIIVKIADAISASRPGARRDTAERYLQRIKELETLITGYEGVERAYAIQAGREIRVFVTPDTVDDMGAYKLAKTMAQNIQEQLQYPGEIKVTLIREKRIIEYAR
ncbi:ribonuclease Y [Candidatus Uhrbacteria bacterium]|nr:ribonuclease Y [Candidatus Uhrbacteria bacterium]